MRRYLTILVMMLWTVVLSAQQFVHLDADALKVDSILPRVGWSQSLPVNYADSVYTVKLVYPEFEEMQPSEVENLLKLHSESLPEIPQPNVNIAFDRKKPLLCVDILPFAFSGGKYLKLKSYMLRVETTANVEAKPMGASGSAQETYALQSVLANGKWAKIRVPESGVFQLTEALIRKAGFSDINKVHVYGYGGNMQKEELHVADLLATDDLKEVGRYIQDGKHYFYAKGPVYWNSSIATTRIRNPYSDYGYYFLTESSEPLQTLTREEFIQTFDRNMLLHDLYEKDAFAWYHGGRNLYDGNSIQSGKPHTFKLQNTNGSTAGKIYIVLTAPDISATAQVELNGKSLGTIRISRQYQDYDKAGTGSGTYNVTDLKEVNDLKVTLQSGTECRLDYASLTYQRCDVDAYFETMVQGGKASVPEYVHNITNQNHHADAQADMVIIFPTSQKFRSEVERLKAFHEQRDGLRVNIVPADELYNEFSSGTPDANAYRRYLKMLYDRAETEADQPKYLLLFGDAIWDNRMIISQARSMSPDDYLLCYESENSVSEVYCYVDDGWFCYMDEGEGVKSMSSDLLDVAVGRLPVTTIADAKIVVDKIIAYAENKNVGMWQNSLTFMGDDGNANLHMTDINATADRVFKTYPQYQVNKIMWDAYKCESTATGHSYPEVTKLVKQQQANSLIMDYAGHGNTYLISHERVLLLSDFSSFSSPNLPMWITASCDIMPFDGFERTVGEVALLNPRSGAIAFFGTMRTVFAQANKHMNTAALLHLLKWENGKPLTIGEALRRAKNYQITTSDVSDRDHSVNKLQYTLLGDPALALNLPAPDVVVETINGVDVENMPEELPKLQAGGIATITGRVEGHPDFNGMVNVIVRDAEEKITCRGNVPAELGNSGKPFTYMDRTRTIFSGSNRIENGKFSISFAVPLDINYSDGQGLITVFANTEDGKFRANGSTEDFIIGGTVEGRNDGRGPSVYCYLNSPSFVNGGTVNPTPYFVAEVSDEDGINTSGNSIGHDLQLIIDDNMYMTYNLNQNFIFDMGSYTTGQLHFQLPELSLGKHKLQFRAWDIFNNSTTSVLDFEVLHALKPELTGVSCTNNPARENTTFIIQHNRAGSEVNIILDIYDTSGRHLWRHEEKTVPSGQTHTIPWDLTVDGGRRLQTGVYLYQVRIASDGSDYVSKAKKIIVI